MENKNVTNVQAGEQGQEQKGQEQQQSNTFTEEQFNKKLQSETDKVRTEYSKKMKDLEKELESLKPKKKSESELELEKRVQALESKEKQLQEKERLFKVAETLENNGLNKQLAKYINMQGVEDLESYVTEIKDTLNKQLINTTYKPAGHKETKDSITREQFNKMGYMERMKLYRDNKELYKKLNDK